MFCELTIKDGKVIYDLDAISGDPWDQAPGRSVREAKRWTRLRERGLGDSQWRPLPAQLLIKDWTHYPWDGKNPPTK